LISALILYNVNSTPKKGQCGVRENDNDNKLFYANQRLDFRGITDAAGTTF